MVWNGGYDDFGSGWPHYAYGLDKAVLPVPEEYSKFHTTFGCVQNCEASDVFALLNRKLQSSMVVGRRSVQAGRLSVV